MSSNTIFSSVESEKRWVFAMDKNFPQQHIVDIDFDSSSCVFRVPKNLTEEKPEAYAPQHLGLGPYHHLCPELYAMEKQKLAAIRKFLGPEKLQKFRQVVEALVQWGPVLRACYDQYLDLDIETLAWILAIDGLYLLHFLKNYPETENLAGDVLTLENQIPVVLLNKIRQVLQLSPVNDYSFFEEYFQAFCEDQSPLKLTDLRAVIGNTNQSHLLHRMYYLIVNNTSVHDGLNLMSTFSSGTTSISLDDVVESLEFLGERGLRGAGTAGKILSFVEKIPWIKILGLFKKGGGEENPSVEEIDIPSVSRMTETAGIKFTLTPGGIRDIMFDDHDQEGKKFYLPVVRVTATSEVILRNLVAYEAATAKSGSTLELTEYVDLMCGIIDSSKDVGILRKEKIVESELTDEEIVRIFNGIGKSTKKSNDKSNIEEAIDNVNTTYGNLCCVKVVRFSKKYGSVLLKFLIMVITITVSVLFILKAFCSVFGCGRWFGFGKITTQGQNPLFSY